MSEQSITVMRFAERNLRVLEARSAFFIPAAATVNNPGTVQQTVPLPAS